jgi:ribosomal protein L16/L10AE
MGKGKGSHSIWVAPIKKGQIICEIISFLINKLNISKKALKSGSTKLPIKTVIVFNSY